MRRAAPQTRVGGVVPLLGLALLVLLLAWSLGLVWFARQALREPGREPAADGIVVLTGGAGRIAAAVELLRHGRARQMLISGVSSRPGLAAVLRAGGVDRPLDPSLAQRISLGREATSTAGNAVEIAVWSRERNLHSLIVVTAGYHMPRALDEIRTALPKIALKPYPVVPPALRRMASLATLRLLVAEYDKWLLVACGVHASAHLRDLA